MYEDAIYRWNVFVGCKFDCLYCRKSFQAQMKRQKPVIDKNGKKRGCQLCYDYEPHFHEERLDNRLPRTKEDQFIWVGSSGDISFIQDENMIQILDKIKEYSNRTFFFQTKNPKWFQKWSFPENVILGITLETDIPYLTKRYSKTFIPSMRVKDFSSVKHKRKCITIEPILKFYLYTMLSYCLKIDPERVYIGYDSKKNKLSEPSLFHTNQLITSLKRILPTCKIKEKLIRKAWWEK